MKTLIFAMLLTFFSAYLVCKVFMPNHRQIYILRFMVLLIFMMLPAIWTGYLLSRYNLERFEGGSTKALLESKIKSADFNGVNPLSLPVNVKIDKGRIISWSFGNARLEKITASIQK